MEEGEEERATTVANREGKAKSRWAVANLPGFTKGRPGLHLRSEILLLLARHLTNMLERDHMSTKHGV